MLGLWASKRGEPFLCLHAEPCANFRDATVHQDPKRWACGRRYEANPSSASAVRFESGLTPASAGDQGAQNLRKPKGKAA